MRGEYADDALVPAKVSELPPRARRIRKLVRRTQGGHGTTSACAENTLHAHICQIRGRNYLRVRGEYPPSTRRYWCKRELPPRARRIRQYAQDNGIHVRTTSACAENTVWFGRPRSRPGNYLRVRGEYGKMPDGYGIFSELPPRARRILLSFFASLAWFGTTSACAENTDSLNYFPWSWRNYLRVRGEYQ